MLLINSWRGRWIIQVYPILQLIRIRSKTRCCLACQNLNLSINIMLGQFILTNPWVLWLDQILRPFRLRTKHASSTQRISLCLRSDWLIVRRPRYFRFEIVVNSYWSDLVQWIILVKPWSSSWLVLKLHAPQVLAHLLRLIRTRTRRILESVHKSNLLGGEPIRVPLLTHVLVLLDIQIHTVRSRTCVQVEHLLVLPEGGKSS